MEPTPLAPVGGSAVAQTALGGSAPVSFNVWHLFMQADIVVKVVMILLLLASVWSWAIIIDKLVRFRKVRQRMDLFEETFWSGSALDDLFDRVSGRGADNPMALMFIAAMREWRRAGERGLRAMAHNLQERVERVMSVTLNREMDDLGRYLGFLATVGSTAPFLGLFGTVWGIMHSFQAIALSHNTSLAVVAPGIAEALFATALGLVAAIPAVIGYNKFSGDVNQFGSRLDGFSEEFSAILSRQLDERAA